MSVYPSIWAQTGHPVIACTWQAWDVKGKPRWMDRHSFLPHNL